MVSIESFIALQHRKMTGSKDTVKEEENEEVLEVEGEMKDSDGAEREGQKKDLVLADPKVSRKSIVHPVDPVLDRALFDR